MLDRHLPSDRLTREYFICGPDPMLDACENGLRSLGVSWRRIYTERFEVV
jgi:ferredoxin-NADP reductase